MNRLRLRAATSTFTRALSLGALLATLAAPDSAQAQIIYGLSNGSGSAANTTIYQINPTNAQLTNIVPVTLPGFSVGRALAMAAQPGTGTLFAVLQTSVDTSVNRRLATIDPIAGVATNIGSLAGSFASLAFRADGILYGVTGQNGANPETLFTISTVNASTSLLFALGNGFDGETIAFHPNGLLYHASREIFESVNVDTHQVISLATGLPGSELTGMGFFPTTGTMLGSDLSSNFFSININTGAQIEIGNLGVNNRAVAFVGPSSIPEPATSVAIAGAVMLGLAVWRRRRQTVADGK
jgi:PEP-CTERM motif